MKSMLKIAAGVVMVVMLSSCVVHDRRGMPPGHAKRVYGGSARYYAPGHADRVYIYDDRGHHHKGRGHRHYR